MTGHALGAAAIPFRTSVLQCDTLQRTDSRIFSTTVALVCTEISRLLIWVSGVKAVSVRGIPEESIGHGGWIMCDQYMRIKGVGCAFSAGDMSLSSEDAYPKGGPQLAQVAMQQAALIARNLNAVSASREQKPFRYHDFGSMATIGRNRAVADLGSVHLSGFLAWIIWMTVHLRSILGVRNRIIVLIDWIVNHFSFRNSMKLLLFKGRR